MKKYNEDVINAFALYQRTVDLMKATGLSHTTIVKYKKDEELLELANQRRGEIIKTTVNRLQGEMINSLRVLCKIRDNERVNPQVRVSACNSIFNNCRAWTETVDILERVEALEKKERETHG